MRSRKQDKIRSKLHYFTNMSFSRGYFLNILKKILDKFRKKSTAAGLLSNVYCHLKSIEGSKSFLTLKFLIKKNLNALIEKINFVTQLM